MNSFILRDRNIGLLVMRIGIGFFFLIHGYPKLEGGYETWTWLGGRMHLLGIDFWPALWGFLAAFAEFGGGLLLIAGLFTRYASLALVFTMLVAGLHHLSNGDGLSGASHAFELMVVFIALAMIGPGNLSLDKRLFNRA